jgi:hypothetical protein
LDSGYFRCNDGANAHLVSSATATAGDEALQVGVQNQLVWRWSASGQYSSSTAYQSMFIGQLALLGAKELWKVKAPGKCLFF